MKLLGLRLCEHDSNISYYDGTRLHYFKSERFYQEKHHAFNDLNSWKPLIKELWNVTPDDISDIAIVMDPWKYNLPSEHFFPSKTYDNMVHVNHHYAHALSTFMLTDNADVHIVIDGFGDEDITWTVIRDDKIVEEGKLSQCGSLGIHMSNIGHQLQIKNTHGLDYAGKVMGLQSYGKIDHEYMAVLKPFGIRNTNDIFDYSKWIAYKGDVLLAELSRLDWIKTIHHHVGEKLVEFFYEFCSPNDNVTYSGGVAQNVIWNTMIKQSFPKLHIPPHCADEGLSLGAIEFLRRKHNLEKFVIDDFPYIQYDQEPELPSDETIKIAAQMLADGKIVSWYQGHGEVGPRALGNRSILMDPRITNGKDVINSVKKREQYRPFGASVLSSKKDQWFDVCDNPYMLYVGKPLKHLPAITHIDKTCRVQTVEETTLFGKLLKEFYNLTGCPVLLNTSLNLAGKPIEAYEANALELFKTTNINSMVIGNRIYVKE